MQCLTGHVLGGRALLGNVIFMGSDYRLLPWAM